MSDFRFSVDARTVLSLGRESIKDHATAVIELVKNAYDAGASKVRVVLRAAGDTDAGSLRLVDNGHGMTMSDLRTRWLRIGFSDKRESRYALSGERRVLGEKGIGRLSSDRLGSVLELRTRASGGRFVGLRVDWDRFVTSDTDIGAVTIDALPSANFQLMKDADTGTELTIRNLRNEWDTDDVEQLRDELAAFLPPYAADTAFSIVLDTDVARDLSGPVESELVNVAPLELKATLESDGSIVCEVFDRQSTPRRAKRHSYQRTWSQIQASSNQRPTCGSATVHLYFFPRKASTVEGTSLTLRDLRAWLDRHGGVRVYRDGVRVRPYGGPGEQGDWLGLGRRKTRDPAGRRRKTFKIAPSQLIGAIAIGRDANPELIDSASREGLVANDALADLQTFVLGALVWLESHYHETAPSEEEQISLGVRETRASLQRSIDQIDTISAELQRAEQNRDPDIDVADVVTRLAATSEELHAAAAAVREIENEAMTYRGLATLGIAAGVFAHEVQSSLVGLRTAIRATDSILRKSEESARARSELAKAVRVADRISAWGAFALARLKRDKRRKKRIDVASMAERIATELRPAFESAEISIRAATQPATGVMYAVDVESVLTNLLTNAYAACLRQRDREREVLVSVSISTKTGREGVALVVEDSGPGIPTEIRGRIWEPLFTTKQDTAGGGTGLGLAIVKSILDEHGGDHTVGSSSKLGGAKFKIWLPFEE